MAGLSEDAESLGVRNWKSRAEVGQYPVVLEGLISREVSSKQLKDKHTLHLSQNSTFHASLEIFSLTSVAFVASAEGNHISQKKPFPKKHVLLVLRK